MSPYLMQEVMQAKGRQVSWTLHHWYRCWYADAAQHVAHHTHWEYRFQLVLPLPPLLWLPMVCLSGCSCGNDGCCGGCCRPELALHSQAVRCCRQLQSPGQLLHCEGCRRQQQWAWKTQTG
jgi:hypothetical protein